MTQRMEASQETPTALGGEAMAEQFRRNLLQNEGAMAYVRERGIHPRLIESGRVGFCPPYARHWFPLLRGRVTVTIRDVHGEIVAFAGRQHEAMRELTERSLWDTYGHEPKKAEERILRWRKGKWINETYPKNRHLYNLDLAKDAARERGYLVLVEGYFDALVLASKSLPNTAAVCGVELSPIHAALISRYCGRVVLLMDGDAAGRKSLDKITATLEEADLRHHALFLPEGHDPDDFVRKYGGKNLRRAMEHAIEQNLAELNIEVTD